MRLQLTFLLLEFLLAGAFAVHGSAGLAFSASSIRSVYEWKRYVRLAESPHYQESHHLSPSNHPRTKGRHSSHSAFKRVDAAPPTSYDHPVKKRLPGSAFSQSPLGHKNHHKNEFRHIMPGPHRHFLPPPSWLGPVISPLLSPVPSPRSWGSIAPAPQYPSGEFRMPENSPAVSPLSSSFKTKSPSQSPVLVFPPPPPSQDCTLLSCTEPLTYSPPGSACGCVLPFVVKLRLSISLYTFFPFVTELAKEISAATSLNQSQVRIMGANVANQQLKETIVIIDLLPQDGKFDSNLALSIYKKFWEREVLVMSSTFGSYEVVSINYPGLPPSPPSADASGANINDPYYPGNGNDGTVIKPLGVDVPKRKRRERDRRMIVIVVVSSVTAFVACVALLWFLLIKCGCCNFVPQQTPHIPLSSKRKLSGGATSLALGSKGSSMSHTSSMLAYTGTAKVFNINDIEIATDNFDTSRILGEGGFGLVYSGDLVDGKKVAVKVLKRADHQGSREFLAEVEMLSRLHHRNLVKLIGICTEPNCRCLVYELVPNGSVESHLHGIDQEASPLDWSTRMNIAMGAARGLAYLHEDSSPRVIHRDFKSSNILLEDDFTPKVSDFGLAKSAMDDEANKHISTHVMGTFGYLAPEYAMTGHLLVKSDVYSYGVVLLELLTGRKPIDLSQPPGEENLVSWARPLLGTTEGIDAILDPSLKANVSFDSVSKVAAIASMCVQPEVSHRPFMGEVVQALTLVCNEYDEIKGEMSRSLSQEELSIDINSKTSVTSGELMEAPQGQYIMPGDDDDFSARIALSATDLKSVEARVGKQESSSFRQFNSAPLNMGTKKRFWQRLKFLSRGSMSEHRLGYK